MPEESTADELSYLRLEVKRLREKLNTITPPLEMLLRRRGFRIYKKEPSADLLIPEPEFLDNFYHMLNKYSFRLFLRDVIKKQDFFRREDVTRYSTSEVTGKYLHYIERIGLATKTGGGFRLVRRVKSFGGTLEWYVAEIFRRDFGAEVIWGVKFKRPGIGGDYDVIAKFDGSIIYLEVKSSPPKQIYESEIGGFLDRVGDLTPEMAFFVMDTELRMRDKIVPMFEKELEKRYSEPPGVGRIERELFHIEERIFIINSKDNLLRNIETVLFRYFTAKSK